MFNTINLNSVVNNSITGADFNAYDGTSPLVTLAATGQTTSYVSGDDASLKKGVAWPGTGLTWLKKADCINQTWAGAIAAINTLASGQCGLTDGSTAGQWRMPNRKEMESLSDRAQNNLADYFDETFVSGTAGNLPENSSGSYGHYVRPS